MRQRPHMLLHNLDSKSSLQRGDFFEISARSSQRTEHVGNVDRVGERGGVIGIHNHYSSAVGGDRLSPALGNRIHLSAGHEIQALSLG